MGGGRKILYTQFMHSLEIFSIIKSTVAALQSNVRSCDPSILPPLEISVRISLWIDEIHEKWRGRIDSAFRIDFWWSGKNEISGMLMIFQKLLKIKGNVKKI